MATPNPPPSTPQTSAAVAPKRHRHRRHAPQQPSLPEEPPSPADLGRVDGSAPPPRSFQSSIAGLISGHSRPPAAPNEASVGGLVVEGSRTAAGKLLSSCSSGIPPGSAVCAGSGKPFPTPETVPSSGRKSRGKKKMVEETEDFRRLPPVSAIEAMPGNAGTRNLAGIWTDCASQVFDGLPVRNQSLNFGLEVQVVPGEIWEKGSDEIARKGSSIQTFLSSPVHSADIARQAVPATSNTGITQRAGATGGPLDNLYAPVDVVERAGRDLGGSPSVQAGLPAATGGLSGQADSSTVQQAQAYHFAANTHRSGTKGGTADDLHAAAGGVGRAGSVPGTAGGTAGLISAAPLPVQRAISGRLPRAANSLSDGFEGSLSAQWYDGDAVFNSGAVGSEGGAGGETSGASKMAPIWADCDIAGTDFGHIGDATDLDSMGGQPRGQGGMVEGHFGSTLGMVGGVGVSRTRVKAPI